MSEGASSHPDALDPAKDKARSDFLKMLKFYGVWMRKDLYAWKDEEWDKVAFDEENWRKLKFLNNMGKVKEKHYIHLEQLREAKKNQQTSFEEDGKTFTIDPKKDYHEEEAHLVYTEGKITDSNGNIKTTDTFGEETVPIMRYDKAFELVRKMFNAQKELVGETRAAETTTAQERAEAERVGEAAAEDSTPGAGAARGEKKKKKKKKGGLDPFIDGTHLDKRFTEGNLSGPSTSILDRLSRI